MRPILALCLESKSPEEGRSVVLLTVRLGFDMHFSIRFFFTSLLLGVGILVLQAQNDECRNAAALGAVVDFCSAPTAYTTAGAGVDGGRPTCDGIGEDPDVWFSFVATRTAATIQVNGALPGSSATMTQPAFALYTGDCNRLQEVGCGRNEARQPTVSLVVAGLVPGQTYRIRVSGGAGGTGSFQVCVRAFTPLPSPSSDCSTARQICGSPTPFAVSSIIGAGASTNELADADCLFNRESNSAWFKFEVAQDGDLEFNLVPDNPSTDLDFAFYELPGGLADCGRKRLLRCMGTGGARTDEEFRRCLGPTGMRIGDPDVVEAPNCQSGDNNYISSVRLVAGKAYALVVINFTADGSGFAIDWGRTTAIAAGPRAPILVSPLGNPCATTRFAFDTDPVPGAVYTWNFGLGASPATATGAGTHTVDFTGEPGDRFVSLTVKQGDCETSSSSTIQVVNGPSFTASAVITPATCGNPTGGAVTLTVDPVGDYLFELDGGLAQRSGTFSAVALGSHVVSIRAASGPDACRQTLNLVVSRAGGTRPQLLSSEVVPASCPGVADGSLRVVGQPGIELSYQGSPFAPTAVFTDLLPGDYVIALRSGSGCTADTTLTVGAGAGPDFSLITVGPTSCAYVADGRAVLPEGGESYAINGGVAQSSSTFEGLGVGTYTYRVTTVSGCDAVGDFTIAAGNRPPGIGQVDVLDASCPEVADGVIRLALSGMRTYLLNDEVFPPDGRRAMLSVGNYTLRVTDARGCVADTILTVGGRAGYSVELGPDLELQFGDSVTLRPRVDPTERMPVRYVYTGLPNVDTLGAGATLTFLPLSTPLAVGLTVTDARGCQASDEILIVIRVPKDIAAPTAFSPNGDLVNDRFTVLGGPSVARVQRLQIFNRWGGIVFSLDNFPVSEPEFGWDGTTRGQVCEVGVYTYVAVVEFVDGATRTLAGSVNLMR